MKFTLIILTAVFSLSSLSRAEDSICHSLTDLRKSVVYCDENFDYYKAAKACKEKYLQEVKVEQKRIQKELENQMSLISKVDAAQKENFSESSKVLTTAITDLDYLIDYGKQAHTEIEDYVYELVLPIFDEKEAKADINDKKVKALFMSRECYGDPTKEMEKMEKEIQVVVSSLEKTKDEATNLQRKTASYESKLNVAKEGSMAPFKSENSKAKSAKIPEGKKTRTKESDISGTKEPEQKK